MSMKSDERQRVTRDLTKAYVLPSLLCGAALAAAFYGALVIWLFPDTYFGEIFAQRGSIPYFTTFLCSGGLFLLLFAWLRLRREESTFAAVRETLLHVEQLSRENAQSQITALERISAEKKGHIASNRFLRALHRLRDGIKEKTDLAELLRDQAEIDQAIIANTHAPVKFVIWLIPILGFIGTVLGVSNAISGFSSLIQASSDFAAVRDNLGEVARHLGVAFETTLLALIKTSVLMFAFSMIQKRENALLIRLDEFCADDLMKRVAPLPRTEREKSEEALLTDALNGLTERISHWDPQFSQTLDGFFARLHQLAGELAQGFGRAAGNTVTALARHTERSAAVFRDAAAGTEDLLARHRGALAENGDRFLEGLHAEVSAVREHGSTLLQSTERTTTAIGEATKAGEDAARNITVSARSLAESTERLGALSTALDGNVRRLVALDEFNGCLEALRGTVGQLPGILSELKRPRQITLVESALED